MRGGAAGRDEREKRMSELVVYLLLALALVAPVAGAVALRVLAQRLTEVQALGIATALVVLAVASTLLLARSDVSSLHIGGYTLLLPATTNRPVAVPAVLPAAPASLPRPRLVTSTPLTVTEPITATMPVTATEPLTVTEPITATMPVTATEPLTVTEPITVTEPLTPTTPITATEPVSPTEQAPPAEDEEAPAPPAPRTYTIEDGDTLRSIADAFGVDVTAIMDANGLTPEEADALRPGDELVIP